MTATADRQGAPILTFAGRLDGEGVALLWSDTMRAARQVPPDRGLTLDLAAVTLCDMTGAAFLLAAEAAHGAPVTLRGGQARALALIQHARTAAGKPATPAPPVRPSRWQIGREGLRAATDGIAFLGEAVVALIRLPARRRMLRGADLLRYADEAGVRALPLLLLMGFLIGLILAFQSAIPMRQFGADLYVANLVSISLLRELGPLLAAVILAGRTGSAFAAEIGTMKVNEELDALATMGIDRMTMLVLPRLIAVMLVMPAMTLVLDLAGLLGMTVVMRVFGYPLAAISQQVAAAATVSDLSGGLFKAVCFGATVAAIGCWQGLSTGVGPRAVGLSATGAVVGGIVATIVLDGLFALIFYQLNL
jgi:phospholipid/cholesterol/gamma-HCH transport system permease protein